MDNEELLRQSQEAERRAAAITGIAPVLQNLQPITSSTLAPTQTQTVQIPPTPQIDDGRAALTSIESQINSLLSPQQSPAEQNQSEIIQRILKTSEELTGEQAAQFQAEEQAGVPEIQQQLVQEMNRIQALQKEAAAIPLQIQEEFTGRGATRAGVQPIETGRLRQNAIKALSSSAIAQTLQGNLALAQQQANRAVELEFAPKRAQLDFLKTAYNLNQDLLQRVDKQRAQQLEISLRERERILNEQERDKNFILQIGMESAKLGASAETRDRILSARSPQEALSFAGLTLGTEFRRKVESEQFARQLQSAQFELSLEKFKEDIRQFDERVALDRYKIAQDQTLKDISKFEEQQKTQEANELKLSLLKEKTNLLLDITQHSGLDSRVGPTKFARRAFAASDKFGAGQEFAGMVHQLVDTETLDALINIKARGGTFGALQEKELEVLQNSANKINNWEIKDEFNKPTGEWNVSETAFLREIATIQRLTNVAIDRAIGVVPLDESERNEIEFRSLQHNQTTNALPFSPSNYYAF